MKTSMLWDFFVILLPSTVFTSAAASLPERQQCCSNILTINGFHDLRVVLINKLQELCVLESLDFREYLRLCLYFKINK